MAGRRHRALAAVRRRRRLRRRRRFRVFNGSGGSRVQGGVAELGVDLGEISNAIVCHSEVSLKLGYSGMEDEILGFRCHRLRFPGGAGRLAGTFLKAVFWLFEGNIGGSSSSSRAPVRAEEQVRREAIECELVFEFEGGIGCERGASEKTLEALDSVTAQRKRHELC